MKKEYESPKMEIVDMPYGKILCGSEIDVEPEMCDGNPCSELD